MSDNFVNEIIELVKENNWQYVINKYYNHPERNKLLWVFPSEHNLVFLKEVFTKCACKDVLSIGCGSGLLEWIIIQATDRAERLEEVSSAYNGGVAAWTLAENVQMKNLFDCIKADCVRVQGVEVDGAWWNCKYSPPNFIPLLLTQETQLDDETITELQRTDCLLFCYFNNRPAFINYLRYFGGKTIIIIGPGPGKGVHTDPLPFDDIGEHWKLYKWEEVRNSKDFISVYNKYLF